MLTLLLTLLTAAAEPPPPAPAPPPAAAEAAPLRPIAEMRAAVETKDIPRYQAAWHPDGWSRNLVGSSGLSGEAAAGQAKADGWVFRADASTLAKHGEAEVWVVRCDVVQLRDDRVVDSVFAAIGLHNGKHVVFGAGENLDQVNALAVKMARGEPLFTRPRPSQIPGRRPPAAKR